MTHITPENREDVIGQWVQHQVDEMDVETLIELAMDNLIEYYNTLPNEEIEQNIVENYGEEFFEDGGFGNA